MALGAMAKYGRVNMVKRVFDGQQGHRITEDTISRAFMECKCTSPVFVAYPLLTFHGITENAAGCKGETRWPIAKLFLDRGAEVDYM